MRSLVYYFCYGSNLLIERMRINNKSATKYSNALLNGFKLTFSGNSQLWKGATANIVADPKSIVYGVVYTLTEDDIKNLDRQEIGYDPIEVQVELYEAEHSDNRIINCRTYVQKANYANVDGEKIPSRLYKQVIINGAQDNQLPKDYIDNILKRFNDNGIIDCGPDGLDQIRKALKE